MLDVQRASAWVHPRVSSARFEHIRRVAELCDALARRWDVDPHTAKLTGWLHDCARDVPTEELVRLAESFGIPVSPIERQAPFLLHAPVGAEMVRSELGIDAPHILDPIRFHTTGRSGMSITEKILFVADYAEPGRDFEGIENVRRLMFQDLDGALRLALDMTLKYLIACGQPLHPHTVEARNALCLSGLA